MAHDWPELDIPYHGKLLAGVDEVGRGPLVGSVVTAAVILDPDRPISGLTDSKKLSEKKREAFSEEIRDKALAWHIAECSVAEIDQLNILHATMLAMQRAVAGLKPAAEFVLIDGNRCPDMPCPAMAVVKGDLRHEAISAASILAKVYRDQQMVELEARYPGYGFAQHKGYPTKQHFAALEKLGPIPEHRRSFKPVQQRLDL
ncbi:ribonuclease HII [Oceanospirillum linum]|uniref:Ribonuclease HII n=1 Tax=Oceanospirillum linum TaxID=966 RepID=A0A1T1HFP8_OCELI|nr:ribonuclease HII [Oceanospirillum linum]OOV88632.1 ribonuclease HII [Oceanospirillum linum]SEG04738.1 RNase HII [Oleiphilus messinensis]SMP20905.1 RNase HII [Oceanospirillum linum]